MRTVTASDRKMASSLIFEVPHRLLGSFYNLKEENGLPKIKLIKTFNP
jgi:hypothetical protein